MADTDLSAVGMSQMVPNASMSYSNYDQDENDDRTKYEFKIVLLGDAAVGKTCLLKRYMKNEFSDEHQCSVGVEFESKSISLDQNTVAVVKIWDTCGEEKFKSMTRQYYRDANGILLLFDLTSPSSFMNLKGWIHDLENTINVNNVAIILVGTKADLEKKVSSDEVDKFISKYSFLEYVEISAKTGMNIELVFDKILREMVDNAKKENDEDEDGTNEVINKNEKKEASPANNTKFTIDQNQGKPKKEKKGCC